MKTSICRVRALDDKSTDVFTTHIKQLNSASQKALSSPFQSPSPLKLIILLGSVIIDELWLFMTFLKMNNAVCVPLCTLASFDQYYLRVNTDSIFLLPYFKNVISAFAHPYDDMNNFHFVLYHNSAINIFHVSWWTYAAIFCWFFNQVWSNFSWYCQLSKADISNCISSRWDFLST